MFGFGKKKTPPPEPTQQAADLFSTHDLGPQVTSAAIQFPEIRQPKGAVAMDSEMSGQVVHDRWPLKPGGTGAPHAVMSWFAWQTFIGYQACALIAQHWLVHKACSMPAKDAVRMGWDIDAEG